MKNIIKTTIHTTTSIKLLALCATLVAITPALNAATASLDAYVAGGGNATIDGAGIYPLNTQATLSVTEASENDLFISWGVFDDEANPLLQSMERSMPVHMDANKTAVATVIDLSQETSIKGTIPFGEVHSDNTKSPSSSIVTLTIENEGEAELNVSHIFIPREQSEFSLTFSPTTIQPGESSNFQITFDPSKNGDINGLLVIISNDPDTPIIVHNLAGISIENDTPPTVEGFRTTVPGAVPNGHYTYTGDAIAIQISANDPDANIAALEWYIATPGGNSGINSSTITTNGGLDIITTQIFTLNQGKGAYSIFARATDDKNNTTGWVEIYSIIVGNPTHEVTISARAVPSKNMEKWLIQSTETSHTYEVEEPRGPIEP